MSLMNIQRTVEYLERKAYRDERMTSIDRDDFGEQYDDLCAEIEVAQNELNDLCKRAHTTALTVLKEGI